MVVGSRHILDVRASGWSGDFPISDTKSGSAEIPQGKKGDVLVIYGSWQGKGGNGTVDYKYVYGSSVKPPDRPTNPPAVIPLPPINNTPTPTPTGTPAATPIRSPTATSAPTRCGFSSPPMMHVTTAKAARLGCPIEADRTTNLTSQTFENGWMFWRQLDEQIFILFSDKTWLQFANPWTTGMADDACPNITVAANRLKPKRGFGKVWCEQSGVRAKLGAATVSEVGFPAAVQRFERGQVFSRIDGDSVYTLYFDGKWE
jgi:hypothetical protein